MAGSWETLSDQVRDPPKKKGHSTGTGEGVSSSSVDDDDVLYGRHATEGTFDTFMKESVIKFKFQSFRIDCLRAHLCPYNACDWVSLRHIQ